MGMITQWDVVDEAELERVLAMDEEQLFEWYEDDEGRTSFDIDKLWHGVHAVLTGDVSDSTGFGRAVLGGAPFGPDVGYGQPRALTAGAVREVATALEGLSVEEFRARIDLAELARLDAYPAIWDREDEGPLLVDDLTDGYATVRRGFLDAAAAGMCIVISCM